MTQPSARENTGPSLREQHREFTRALIMRSLAEIIAEYGAHSFTVQEVADRAGISHRTVYRYFPTRDLLLSALADWLEEQLRQHGAPGSPDSLEEGLNAIPLIFDLFDQYEVLVRALVIIYTTTQIRPPTREERTESFARVVREAVPDASEEAQQWLFAITRALANTQAWFFFHYYLGMNGEEAGRAIRWAVETLVREINSGHDGASWISSSERKSKGSGGDDQQSGDESDGREH